MQQDKSFVYTLILGTCVLLCLILIGKIVIYSILDTTAADSRPNVPDTSAQTETHGETRFTDTQIAGMLEKLLPKDFPVDGLSVSTHANGLVRVEGTVTKDTLQTYAKTSAARSALLLLPARFVLRMDFQAICSGTEIRLTPTQLSADGMRLPAAALPSGLADALNQALKSALQNSGISYTQIKLEDGAVVLKA